MTISERRGGHHGPKIVIFGAGRIGRSFTGQLFSRSGYDVLFVDIDKPLIDALNREKHYRVVIRHEAGEEEVVVGPVRGLLLEDHARVAEELATADIASISVGQQGLSALCPVVARALILRRERWNSWPLDVIIAENLRDADIHLARELRKYLPENYPIDALVGLVETSIGKMVPIMTRTALDADPLQLFAEPYNEMIVDRKGFRNPIPGVAQLVPVDPIKAWVDRKLFIHNLGHAAAAYLGYLRHPDAIYMAEVLEDPEIRERTRNTMLQSAGILMALHPGVFSERQLQEHIDDLLHRFRNRALGDTVFRVGCDLFRKLGPADRLVAPVRAALDTGQSCDLILEVIRAALSFRATDGQGGHLEADLRFFAEAERGLAHVLKEVCRLDLPPDLLPETGTSSA